MEEIEQSGVWREGAADWRRALVSMDDSEQMPADMVPRAFAAPSTDSTEHAACFTCQV